MLFVVLSTSRWGRHSRRDPETGTDEALSPREREIVRLVAAGQTGPEIAEQLHISHATVRTHVRNAMAKVGARSRAHLVAKALGDGHALRLKPRRRDRTTAVWTSGARAPRMARPVRRVLSHESGCGPPAWRRPALCGGSEEAAGGRCHPAAQPAASTPGASDGRGPPG